MIGKPSAIPAFGNVVIERNRLRFWIDSGVVEVLVSSDALADTSDGNAAISAATFRQYLTKTKTVEITTICSGGGLPTKVAIKPDCGNFVVMSDKVADQPVIPANIDYDKWVAEIDPGHAQVLVDLIPSVSKDTTRANVNGVWLVDSEAVATDGHKLDKRPLSGAVREKVCIPLAVCKAIAKIEPVSRIVITRGSSGGHRDACQLTCTTDQCVLRFTWRDDASTSHPAWDNIVATMPAIIHRIAVNHDELNGLIKPFKSPMVSFWPDGSMVVHEAPYADTAHDPKIGSYISDRRVPQTDPVWICGPTNFPLPSGAIEVAADNCHARIGSRIMMGCRSHPHENGKPPRLDLREAVQEALALQWELAERIPSKREPFEHAIVRMEREIYAERDRVRTLKASGDWSETTQTAEMELAQRFAELRHKLRDYEMGFRGHTREEIGHDGNPYQVGGHIDLSLVTCGRAALTDRFGGTFWGLTGIRHERDKSGVVHVVDERCGELYSYTPSELEVSCPAISVAKPDKGRMFGGQFEIGHAIAKQPVPAASPPPIKTELPPAPPPPVDEEVPDTIRDPVPPSGVRTVTKPTLYTVGLARVGRATFEHIARSVGATRIVFIGDPKHHRATLSAVDPQFVAVVTVDAAVDAIHDAMAHGPVILAGATLAPTKDGRHEVAQRVFGVRWRWHMIPQKDEILEPYELQASIDEDRVYECYVLSEWLAEQEAKAA